MKAKLSNRVVLIAVASVSALVAYTLGTSQRHATMEILFLAFVAAILAIQLIPAMMLFAGLLKGLLTRSERVEKEWER